MLSPPCLTQCPGNSGRHCLTFSDTLGKPSQSFSTLSSVTRSYRIGSKNEQSLQCNLCRNKLRLMGWSVIKGFIEVRGYWRIEFAVVMC